MHISYEQYHAFSAPLEGRVPKMYCDVFGFITTGVGNLINTLPQALALPWVLEDGTPADKSVVAADWHKLHDNAQHYAKWAWHVYAKELRCHLPEQAIDDLVKRTLSLNEASFRKRWPDYDTFPADAQLAILSMSWAVGAAFYLKFPLLAEAIAKQDWERCVVHCKIKEGTPGKPDWNAGVVPRNARNRVLFHNAALVRAEGGDVTVLHWPNLPPQVEALPTSERSAAVARKADAEVQLAAWQALEISPIVPGSGAALRAYEQA